MMRMLLTHAFIRATEIMRHPGQVAMLSLAAAGSVIAWPLLVRIPVFYLVLSIGGGREWLLGTVALLTLWLWSGLISIPASGLSPSAMYGTACRLRPLPALPIGPRSRSVAEALAGLAMLLAARGLIDVALLNIPVSGDDTLSVFWRILTSLALHPALVGVTVVVSGLVFPVLLAFTTPAHSPAVYFVRPPVVALLAILLPQWLPGERWMQSAAICVVLSTLVLLTWDLPIHAPWHRSRGSQPVTTRWRPAMDPEARFGRDLWQRLVRPVLYLGAPAIVLVHGALLLHAYAGFPALPWLAFGAVAIGLVINIYMMPLGVNVFATDRVTSPSAFLDGAFGRAWARLPVRPERVRRGVYLHGLLTAVALWGLLVTWTLLAMALGLASKPWDLVLPLGLGALCAAGLLLCATVGDGRRGAVSAMALASILPAHVGALILSGLLDLSGTSTLVLDYGVLLVLAIAGGVPPLVHLRR